MRGQIIAGLGGMSVVLPTEKALVGATIEGSSSRIWPSESVRPKGNSD